MKARIVSCLCIEYSAMNKEGARERERVKKIKKTLQVGPARTSTSLTMMYAMSRSIRAHLLTHKTPTVLETNNLTHSWQAAKDLVPKRERSPVEEIRCAWLLSHPLFKTQKTSLI